MTRDPVAAVAEVLSEVAYTNDRAWREAAIEAIRAVKAQLEADASECQFSEDRHALYAGAEQLGEWVEGQE